MRRTTMLFLTLVLLLMLQLHHNSARREGRGGSWELLLNSSGVVAMHIALTHLNTIIFFDQTTSGPSDYPLPCNSSASSCWAHSIEYDISANSLRPLFLTTDTWCSSAAFLSDGTLLQAGGFGSGIRRTRRLHPCSDRRCTWNESGPLLADGRWYATNHILPDDRIFIVGGLNAFTYEFIPRDAATPAIELPFLRQTQDPHVHGGNNLYPFVHLSSDGNLFIFANRDSILFDYRRGKVLRTFPRIAGGSRNYPSTGSSVMLPLNHADGFRRVEIMVCGGASDGAYHAALRGEFYRALTSCGRIAITDEEPKWEMEEMPGPRLMSDMLLLPAGGVLLINGASRGSAGWQNSVDPVLSPYLYNPGGLPGRRFSVLRSSTIARMYHSTAMLLADGRVLVGGSNPYFRYNFSGRPNPTEMRMEAFTPYYMWGLFDYKRAENVIVRSGAGYGEGVVSYGEEFLVEFGLRRRLSKAVEFLAYAPPFVTHSFAMQQRMLLLESWGLERDEGGLVRAVVRAPPSPVVAPSGYYMLTVVNGGIPSKSVWVRFVN